MNDLTVLTNLKTMAASARVIRRELDKGVSTAPRAFGKELDKLIKDMGTDSVSSSYKRLVNAVRKESGCGEKM